MKICLFYFYQWMFTLKLSWQQWSGPSRHATWWHEHTHQVKTHCRTHCPRIQYQPESKLQLSHRPEDRQSHPERRQTDCKEQARTVCVHQHVSAWDLPCMRRLQRLQHRPSDLWSCCPSAYGTPHWSAGAGQPAVGGGGCRELQHTNSKFHSNLNPHVQPDVPLLRSAPTIVAGEAPSAGHAFHSTGEDIWGLSHTHRGHTDVQLGGACQLDERDVIVDGIAIVVRVFENLRRSDLAM